MEIAEISQLVTTTEAEGVTIALTAEDKIRVDGSRPKVQAAVKWIRRRRAEVIVYLKSRDSTNIDIVAGTETVETSDPNAHFTHCPHCNLPLFAPTPENQVANLKKFQRDRINYYWWNDSQLARLERYLSDNPGSVLMLPAFAHSVNVRHADGSVYTHHRVS